MRPTIKIRFSTEREFESRSESYRIVADVLDELGGRNGLVERRELVTAVKARVAELGKRMKVDATVSSLCALPGIEAVFCHADGRTEPFTSRRLETTRKKAGPVQMAEPEDKEANEQVG